MCPRIHSQSCVYFEKKLLYACDAHLINARHLYPCPPPTGMGGDNDFTFQSPGISPALWEQADGYNPALSHTLHNRKILHNRTLGGGVA